MNKECDSCQIIQYLSVILNKLFEEKSHYVAIIDCG